MMAPSGPYLRRHRQALLLMLFVLLGELPLLVKYFIDLWTRPQYDFFPLILLGAAYLAWDRLKDGPPIEAEGRSRVAGVLLLTGSFFLLAIGVVFLVRWLGGVSAWVALAGCILWIGGFRLLRRLSPSLVLLLTIIPLPGRRDETIALGLRQWAVWASGRVLDLLQIPHVLTGTLINISGHRLGVEDACSGIHSLMAVVAVTLMLGFYWHRPAWRIAVLMICSIVFVVWANILRIAVGAYLIIAWKIDILSGSAHELLGLILFLICIGLTASMDQFLQLLPGRESAPTNAPLKTADQAPGRTAAVRYSLATPLTWGLAAAFVLLGAVSQYRVTGLWAASGLKGAGHFNLPATLAGWERVEGSEQVIGRPEVLGTYSSIWNYRKGPRSVLIAFDYPFPGYHELGVCYLASGWQILHASNKGRSNLRGADGAYNELQMQRPSPAFAYLLYGCCDEEGRWLTADSIGNAQGVKLSMALSYQKAIAPAAYQVQVLLQGFDPAGDEEKAQIEQLFLVARDQFADQLVRQVQGAK